MKTIIIGAGIAGLSAGYHLKQAGHDAIILEARDRIGGRIWTNRDFTDIPVEFGAELIHGSTVNTWEWVHKLGLKTLHWQKQGESMVRMEDGRWLSMKEARATEPDFDVTRSWALGDVPEPEDSESLKDYLARIGFSDEQLQYVRRSFANAEGDNMEFLSAKAHANLFEDRDTDVENGYGDFRILDGYDSYYKKVAEGLDIRLNTVVTEIDWSDGVTVKTRSGETFKGDNAVITLTVGILQVNKVKFMPELPPIKQEALAGLGMGPVMKIAFEFDAPITDPKIGAIYSKYNPPMWWSPSFGRDGGAVVWSAFFSGDYAREMLDLGEEKAIEKALNSLRIELGNPDLQYKKASWVNWPHDEFSLGGYSHTKPGHDDAREKLAQPTPPLYWAGEATAPHDLTAMVHGAYYTGQRAANEIIEWD